MGFRQDAYAKLWSVEDQGKYCTGSLTVSKKDDNAENGYTITFRDGYVRFVGDAYQKAMALADSIGKSGVTIKILACDVTTFYSVKSKKNYVNYTVFEFEEVDWDKEKKSKKTSKSTKKKKDEEPEQEGEFAAVDDEDELPF